MSCAPPRAGTAPCPQGAQDGVAAHIGITAKSAATEVRTGCHCRTIGVLDGAGMPAGQRLAPMLAELVAVFAPFRELDIDEDTAELLVSMSAATIDRRLAGERAKYRLKGRGSTKPGSLLKSQIPVRTWAGWDDARPGFVRDRPGRPRRRQPGRAPCVYADGHRYRHRLDREPLSARQDRQMRAGRTQ